MIILFHLHYHLIYMNIYHAQSTISAMSFNMELLNIKDEFGQIFIAKFMSVVQGSKLPFSRLPETHQTRRSAIIIPQLPH